MLGCVLRVALPPLPDRTGCLRGAGCRGVRSALPASSRAMASSAARSLVCRPRKSVQPPEIPLIPPPAHDYIWVFSVARVQAQRVGVGTRMEGDSERHSRLFSSLMDFGEHDLVIRWGVARTAWAFVERS